MRNPAFAALLEEILELHDNKNMDYAEDADPLSNFRECEAMGVPAFTGILVRLTDKWSRIKRLANGRTPKNESLRDSLIDNAVYSLLAILLLDEPAPHAEGSASLPLEAPTLPGGVASAGRGFITTQPCARTVGTGSTGE